MQTKKSFKLNKDLPVSPEASSIFKSPNLLQAVSGAANFVNNANGVKGVSDTASDTLNTELVQEVVKNITKAKDAAKNITPDKPRIDQNHFLNTYQTNDYDGKYPRGGGHNSNWRNMFVRFKQLDPTVTSTADDRARKALQDHSEVFSRIPTNTPVTDIVNQLVPYKSQREKALIQAFVEEAYPDNPAGGVLMVNRMLDNSEVDLSDIEEWTGKDGLFSDGKHFQHFIWRGTPVWYAKSNPDMKRKFEADSKDEIFDAIEKIHDPSAGYEPLRDYINSLDYDKTKNLIQQLETETGRNKLINELNLNPENDEQRKLMNALLQYMASNGNSADSMKTAATKEEEKKEKEDKDRSLLNAFLLGTGLTGAGLAGAGLATRNFTPYETLKEWSNLQKLNHNSTFEDYKNIIRDYSELGHELSKSKYYGMTADQWMKYIRKDNPITSRISKEISGTDWKPDSNVHYKKFSESPTSAFLALLDERTTRSRNNTPKVKELADVGLPVDFSYSDISKMLGKNDFQWDPNISSDSYIDSLKHLINTSPDEVKTMDNFYNYLAATNPQAKNMLDDLTISSGLAVNSNHNSYSKLTDPVYYAGKYLPWIGGGLALGGLGGYALNRMFN